MNGFDPAAMQRVQSLIQQNPRLAMLLQKPGLMQKLQSMVSNPNDPTIASQYQSDPDVQELMSILGPSMGMNNNNNAMGGMNFNNAMMNAQNNNANTNNKGSVTHITSESQFNEILNSSKDKLIIVDFFAQWCGPCKQIAPEVERLASLYKNQCIFLKVDVDRNQELRSKKNITAMPTFQFYKNNELVDEFRGASARKLEQFITKYVTIHDMHKLHRNKGQKASPYKSFPLHEKNRPVYTKAPFKKMKDKLLQLNKKFLSDSSEKRKYSLDDSEWTLLQSMMEILKNKASYHNTIFRNEHYKLLEKLLTWPSDTLPPVLDLIRVLALHPNFAEYCSKNFDFVKKLVKLTGNGMENAVNGMLTCRVIINLFNRSICSRVLQLNLSFIVDHLIFNMMCKERKNTRLAFVRVLLHYCYAFHCLCNGNDADLYRGDKLRCFSLLTEILYRDTEQAIILNSLMGIGTLLFRDKHCIEFAKSIDCEMVFKSHKQKYKSAKDIQDCCEELIKAINDPSA